MGGETDLLIKAQTAYNARKFPLAKKHLCEFFEFAKSNEIPVDAYLLRARYNSDIVHKDFTHYKQCGGNARNYFFEPQGIIRDYEIVRRSNSSLMTEQDNMNYEVMWEMQIQLLLHSKGEIKPKNLPLNCWQDLPDESAHSTCPKLDSNNEHMGDSPSHHKRNNHYLKLGVSFISSIAANVTPEAVKVLFPTEPSTPTPFPMPTAIERSTGLFSSQGRTVQSQLAIFLGLIVALPLIFYVFCVVLVYFLKKLDQKTILKIAEKAEQSPIDEALPESSSELVSAAPALNPSSPTLVAETETIIESLPANDKSKMSVGEPPKPPVPIAPVVTLTAEGSSASAHGLVHAEKLDDEKVSLPQKQDSAALRIEWMKLRPSSKATSHQYYDRLNESAKALLQRLRSKNITADALLKNPFDKIIEDAIRNQVTPEQQMQNPAYTAGLFAIFSKTKSIR